MSIRPIVEETNATTDELCKAVSFFVANIDDIPKEKINQDFYLLNSQVLIDILSDDDRTKPLARLLQDLQGQIGYIIGYTKKTLITVFLLQKADLQAFLSVRLKLFFQKFSHFFLQNLLSIPL